MEGLRGVPFLSCLAFLALVHTHIPIVVHLSRGGPVTGVEGCDE